MKLLIKILRSCITFSDGAKKQSSTIAPWFGKPGLGKQYYSPYFKAFELEDAGYIKKIP